MYTVKTKTLPMEKTKPDQLVLLARTNLDAYKSFDMEDDILFCPLISRDNRETSMSRASTPSSSTSLFSTPDRNDLLKTLSSDAQYVSPSVKFANLQMKTQTHGNYPYFTAASDYNMNKAATAQLLQQFNRTQYGQNVLNSFSSHSYRKRYEPNMRYMNNTKHTF